MLLAALREQGIIAEDLGIVPDDEDVLEAKLREAQQYDLVVTSGGVSMGIWLEEGWTLDKLGRCTAILWG